MSHLALLHCEKLPTVSNRQAGRPGKCPLCKEEVIVAWRNGGTYRLATPEEIDASRRPGRTLAGAGIVATALLASAMVAVVLLNQTNSQTRRNDGPTQAQSSQKQESDLRVANEQPVVVVSAVTKTPVQKTASVVIPQGVKSAPSAWRVAGWSKAGPHKGQTVATVASASRPAGQNREASSYLAEAFLQRGAIAQQLLGFIPEVALEEPVVRDVKQPNCTFNNRRKPSTSRTRTTRMRSSRGSWKNGLTWLVYSCGWARTASCSTQSAASCRKCRPSSARPWTLANPFARVSPRSDSRLTIWSSLIRTPRPSHPGRLLINTATMPTSNPRPFQPCTRFSPANRQICRLSLLEYLKSVPNAEASAALARRAVFDLNPNVRSRAVQLLKDRRSSEYRRRSPARSAVSLGSGGRKCR